MDPIIFPLAAVAVAGALTPKTVKWSEIEAWVEGKRPGLKASKGKVTITRQNEAGKVTVKATVYCLVDPFLPGKPRPKSLGSHPWEGNRLDRALEGKFNGQQSFEFSL
jgi:hypothetical protein